jgi:alkanesulfonate monooxygenase SsuD/methylene tetrahydromethanopterin reductase-like flavin-dependent oxidoreductase (luciferase family)
VTALGIVLAGAQDARQWARVRALAERADRLGLHSVWLPEGHFRRGATPSPLVALAALSARTRRLHLATTSVLLPIHAPLRIAAEVAVLDVLSGGRVILGLGRGFQPAVFEAFGVRASSKRDLFDEGLDAILRAWRDAEADARSEAVGTSAAPRVPHPLQRPHPPLVVAAFGRKGILQAARRGLPYLASPLETLAALEENYATWREHLAAEPNAAAPRVPVMRTVHVAASDAEAARVRLALHAELAPAVARASTALARAAGGRLEDRVVVGTVGFVTSALARYRERLGMDLLVARTEVPGATEPERDASLERLAAEVLPAFRSG